MTALKPTNDPAPDRKEDYDRRLATRIREQRKSRGWTQRELSQRSGISADRLSRLERGAPIRGDELMALGRALGCGLDELMLPSAGGTQTGNAEDLVRQILQMLPQEHLPPLTSLLQKVVLCLRVRRPGEPKGDAE